MLGFQGLSADDRSSEGEPGTNPDEFPTEGRLPMLLEYVQAGLRHAKYEILPDDGNYYGAIPECTGVYANAMTLEDCREELREVLEGWVLFRVHRNFSPPAMLGR
jgi:predicted RNase H-like HicB family nuclease